MVRTATRERGMTLIEMVVAIPIMAILLLAMFYSVDALTNSSRMSNWKITAAAENFKGLQAVREDLLQAFPNEDGPNRYMVGSGGAWLSYRMVDAEVLAPDGRVGPIVSPRVYVYLDGGKLIRAVVDEGEVTGPVVPADAIREVRVLATHVASVHFGDPALHAGTFTISLTTLAGDPETDEHVQSTNFVSVTPLNRAPYASQDTGVATTPLVYVPASRTTPYNDLAFMIRNTTDSDILVNGFQLDWSGDLSYAMRVQFDDTSVWKMWHDPQWGVGPGEQRFFTEMASRTIPAGGQVGILFHDFEATRDGYGANRPPRDETEYTFTLYLDGTARNPVIIPAE